MTVKSKSRTGPRHVDAQGRLIIWPTFTHTHTNAALLTVKIADTCTVLVFRLDTSKR